MTPPRRRRREPRPAGDLLRRWQRAPGSGDHLAALRAAWPTAAGPVAARQSTPLRRSRAGVVTIGCASAAWAQELAARSDVLLPRLARAVPGVSVVVLRFAVADHALPPEPTPAPSAPPRPTAAEREAARRVGAGVERSDLRALIERAAAASLARERTKMPAKRAERRGR
jgi:hypothetical protein